MQGFLVEYRRNDTPTWRRIDTSEAGEGGSQDGTISPESRSHVIFSMESEEFYEFRVAGFNGRGVGGFGETVEPLLSHVIGVPSPPTIPRVVGWNQSRVTIATAVTKFGSRMNFSLGSILILNDTDTTADVIMGYLSEDYTLGEEVELTLVNVSYRGDLKFAVIASNYLGSSPQSDSSLKGEGMCVDSSLKGEGMCVDSSLKGEGMCVDSSLKGECMCVDSSLKGECMCDEKDECLFN